MIDILMATFNGGQFIEDQLDSILCQTYSEWKLIIADDCSTDNTVSILEKYQRKYPDKISFYVNEYPTGSAKKNFFLLLDKASSDYVMLADQDDIWLKDKIELTYKMMLKAEKENDIDTPLLVHTDLCVVDQKLSVINKSIFAMQQMDYHRDQLNNLLVSNIVTGCTTMVNRALLNMLGRKPENTIMHDMWLALVAAAFGKIYFINKSTILYRQHGNNSNGAKNVTSADYLVEKITHLKEVHKSLGEHYRQAEEFLEIFKERLSTNQIIMLDSYSKMDSYCLLKKIRVLKRFDLFKVGFIRVIGQIVC